MDVEPFVSTGALPDDAAVQALLDETWADLVGVRTGALSTVYPVLAAQSPDLFGISVVSAGGRQWETGDVDQDFPIMSVAKPFVFALVCAAVGGEVARRLIGVDATGAAFDSAALFERGAGPTTNPMVNVGALVTVSLAPGAGPEEQWRWLLDGVSAFAGRPLAEMPEALASARATNHRNQGLARLLRAQGYDRVSEETVDLYTRVCCLGVTTHDLAVMGATLADGGVQPMTGTRVVPAEACRQTLAVMATAGMYETSGSWLFTVGLPAKSGIAGGIVTAAPGKGGMGTFSPRLDAAGNSVRGQLAAVAMSRALGLDLFASRPEPREG